MENKSNNNIDTKVSLLKEIYDVVHDLNNNSLTLVRIYVLIFFCLSFAFAAIGFIFLLIGEYYLSLIFLVEIGIIYIILINRKKSFIFKRFHIITAVACHLLVFITLLFNVCIYGIQAGAQLYIILLVGMNYFLTISVNNKDNINSFLIFILDIFALIVLFYVDHFFVSTSNDSRIAYDILFLITIFTIIAIFTCAIYISGVKSISDIEKIIKLKVKVNESNKNNQQDTSGILTKKDFTHILLLQSDRLYKHLNICIFKFTFKESRSEFIFNFDHDYQENIAKQLASELKLYFPNENFILRWNLTSFVVILEQNNEDFYLVLENIMHTFKDKINKNANRRIFLKIIAKHYINVDTYKRPKILLDKIAEVVKLKHETKSIGAEYILYQYDNLKTDKIIKSVYE